LRCWSSNNLSGEGYWYGLALVVGGGREEVSSRAVWRKEIDESGVLEILARG
jgi:hypothetical protein